MLCIVVPICTVGAGLGIWLFVKVARQLAEGVRAANWPQTCGIVSSAERQVSAEGDTCEVVVRYSYSVDGLDFEGTRIHPAYWGSSERRVHDRLEATLRPGTRVRVYYRDDSPTESTLTVGLFSGTLAVLFAACGCIAMGCGLMLVGCYADWQDDGKVSHPVGIVGGCVAGGGFLLSWLLAVWFCMRGNNRFAESATVEEKPVV